MPAPSTVGIALACGTAGAYVDVTSYLVTDTPVTREWGKQSDFEDDGPGTFSFTLDNRDGRFTPDNTASPLVLKLVEGMGASWIMGSRLVSGEIRSITPIFPSLIASSARMRITCVDMLGDPGRTTISNLPDSLNLQASPQLMWLLDDSDSATDAQEQSGAQIGPLIQSQDVPSATQVAQFGVDAIPGIPGTQVLLRAEVGETNFLGTALVADMTNITYTTGSLGFWGFWVAPSAAVTLLVQHTFPQYGFRLGVFQNVVRIEGGSAFTDYTMTAAENAKPQYLVMGITAVLSGTWTITGTLYVNGVSRATVVYSDPIYGSAVPHLTNADKQPTLVRFEATPGVSSGTISIVGRLSHTLTLSREDYAAGITEASRLTGIAATSPNIVLGTLPSDLSTAALSTNTSGASSTLDALNDVIRTERGYLYTATTGTLLAPVQQVRVRARTRGTTLAVPAFNVTTDVIDAPDFIRSITDTVSSVDVTAPDHSVMVTDAALVAQVGSANTPESVLFADRVDSIMYGQDRLLRGKTVGVRIASFTIDARATAADRWANIAALIPGDRLQVSGLPSAQLGYSTWDGWLIGGTEEHTIEHAYFTFYVAQALPKAAIFDTNRFMASGELSLSAGINSVVTSASVATSGAKLDTVDVPYSLLIDSEQVTVTACTGATPQVLTIVRGQGGTTAAAHTTVSTIDVTPTSLFDF